MCLTQCLTPPPPPPPTPLTNPPGAVTSTAHSSDRCSATPVYIQPAVPTPVYIQPAVPKCHLPCLPTASPLGRHHGQPGAVWSELGRPGHCCRPALHAHTAQARFALSSSIEAGASVPGTPGAQRQELGVLQPAGGWAAGAAGSAGARVPLCHLQVHRLGIVPWPLCWHLLGC